MVARDIALVAPDGRARPLPAPVDGGLGRPGPPGQGGRPAGHRRGGAAPHAPDARPGRRLRPGLQGEPAAAHRSGRRRRASPDCATAPSTRSPPTTRRTRPRPRTCPSTRRRRACSGLQTALPVAWEVLSSRLGPERVFALMSAQPAAIAKLTATDPRRRRPQRAGRTGRGRRGGQPLRVRPRRDDGGGTGRGWPAGAATRRTPAARSRVRCATPCSGASRS